MAVESALIIWARGLAERAAADPIIKAANEAADRLRKVVVQTPEDATSVTALLDAVRKGRSNAKKSLDDIQRDPKSAIAEAKAFLDPIIKAFEEVEAAGKSAVARYLMEQQEVARAAERAAQVAAVSVAEASSLPAMEQEPVAVQSIVRSGTGASVHLVKRLHVEMLDAVAVAAFDSTLLKLVDSEALASYRYHESREPLDMKKHPSGGVEWHGMRFYEEATVAQRGAR
jgi:nucleoid-associated protein YgaU